MGTHEVIRRQLDQPVITLEHAGGVCTLTPEQARAVLAGGELVVDALGVRVK